MGQISDCLLVKVNLEDNSNEKLDASPEQYKAIRKWTFLTFIDADYSREGITGRFDGESLKKTSYQNPGGWFELVEGLNIKVSNRHETEKILEVRNFRRVVGASMVSAEAKWSPDIECTSMNKNKYKFTQEFDINWQSTQPDYSDFRMVVLHVVLPENCYIDEFEFINETGKNALIATHEKIQTINWIHKIERGQTLMQEVKFIYDPGRFPFIPKGIKPVPPFPKSVRYSERSNIPER